MSAFDRFGPPAGPAREPWEQAQLAQQAGEHARAWDCLQATIDANPAWMPAWALLGNLAQAAGETRLALAYWQAALELVPSETGLWRPIAHSRAELGEYDDAIAAYRIYLDAWPADAEAWLNLAKCYHFRHWTAHEAACLERYLQLVPEQRRMLRWQGMIRFYFGDWEWLPDFFVRELGLLTASPPSVELQQPLPDTACLPPLRRLLELDYLRYLFTDSEIDDQQLFQWIRQCHRSEPAAARRIAPARHAGPLRVGLLSAEFGSFASATLVLPLVLHHSEQVAYYLYDDTPPEEAARRDQLPPLIWRTIHAATDAEVMDAIRADGIDVLVDLTGITHQHRHGVYAARPAPVQISGFGFVFSSGLACMDYCISDKVLCPPEIAALYPEKVVHLKSAFHWQPPEAFALDAPPGLHQGYITLGAAHTLNRLRPRVIALWARILQALPTARLFLKTVVLADPQTQELYRARFAAHGIDPARIRLEGHGQGHHVSYFYPQIDIALDPFPYSGGVTTSEALWMGVPVAVMDQPQWRARALSVSLYHSLGLQDWLAHSEDEYLERVVAWAQNRVFLQTQRQTLRARLLASTICDGPGFAREAEALFVSLRRGASP